MSATPSEWTPEEIARARGIVEEWVFAPFTTQTDRRADLASRFATALAAEREEREKVARKYALASRLINRLPMCSDHRDKFSPEQCQACRAEVAERDRDRAYRVALEGNPVFTSLRLQCDALVSALTETLALVADHWMQHPSATVDHEAWRQARLAEWSAALKLAQNT